MKESVDKQIKEVFVLRMPVSLSFARGYDRAKNDLAATIADLI
jgi:hypothetical protein